MKTKSTLTSFQKTTKVKALTTKQKLSVQGGCVYKKMGWMTEGGENNSEEANELLQPMAFFKC